MKKKVFVFISLFTLAFCTFAQESFDSVCAKLSEHPNMTGKFTQTKHISAVNRSLKSSGTFIFSLDGIMWKTEKPFPSTLAVGMTSVIQTMANGKQTVIDASSNQIFTSISTTLSAVFSGDAQKITENFSVDYSAAGATWKALLTPKDSAVKAILSSIEIGGALSASTADLSRIVMTEANADTITYLFTDQTYPKELSADEKAYFIAK